MNGIPAVQDGNDGGYWRPVTSCRHTKRSPFISYVFSLPEIRLENFLRTTINASDSPPLSKV